MPKDSTEDIEILLFEDNVADAHRIAECCEHSLPDYRISTVNRLQEGLQAISEGAFKVILLDLNLPDSNGIPTLEQVLRHITDELVIVLTEAGDDALRLEALQAGAQDYLVKDRLSGEVLGRSIRYAIERQNLTRKLEKQAAEMQCCEALQRGMFDSSPDAMLILTPDQAIKFHNPAAATLLESGKASLVGEAFPFEACPGQVSEIEISKTNQAPHLLELRAVDLFWEGERARLVVLRDITKQKRAEEERFKAEKLNSISLLAGGIAHDFNNMLTAILGNISVVRMDIKGEHKHSTKLLAAETAALQARSLTQQLLTLSKGGAPALRLATIDQVVEESTQFILRGSNVRCEIVKEEDLWAVDADTGQISQVINNLIINADQAMPDGGTIRLKLSNRRVRHSDVPTLEAGEYVCIEVKDEGLGISPENLTRIFDPYFTTKERGNGLGLASSYSIIKSHQGTMTADSVVGQGSSFCVYLPKTSQEQPVAENPAKHASSTEGSVIHKGRGRILVMDDMEAMMMVAGEILNLLGYEVEFSTNGEEAIEAYKKAKESGKPFDAVVFDLTVPGGMGGEEASNILIEYDPDMIAIASSGYTTSNVMSDYENSAFKAVVPKPYRIKEMSDALHRVLQSS